MNHTLIIAPAWVGDAVMMHAMVRALVAQSPSARLTVVAPRSTYPLLELMPEVDHRCCMDTPHGSLAISARETMVRQLRQHAEATEPFTHAVVCPNSWKSAWVPWRVGIPVRRGWRGEARWGLLNDLRYLDVDALPTMVQRYVALAHPADAPPPERDTIIPPQLVPQPSVRETFDPQSEGARFLQHAQSPTVALCPGGAFGPAKRWPVEHFASLGGLLVEEGYNVLLLGGPSDRDAAEAIASVVLTQRPSAGVYNLAGVTTLPQAADLMQHVTGVVSNDSGLMHIACALDRPVVALYGSTSPNFTPPLGHRSVVCQEQLPCQPCFQRTCPLEHLACLTTLQPSRVHAALRELLEPAS